MFTRFLLARSQRRLVSACPLQFVPAAQPASSTSTRTNFNDSWSGLNASVQSALQEIGLHAPTATQRQYIPHILAGSSVLVQAPTGTGKTLAYLAPVVQLLKDDETARHTVTRSKRPRALVLVPTRELAVQVLGVVKQLSHVVKLRAVSVLGGCKQALHRAALDSAVDIVVATPGRLALLREQGYLHLSDVRYVVIDEADTLTSDREGFLAEVQALLTPLRAAHAQRQGDAARAAGSAVAMVAAAPGAPAVAAVSSGGLQFVLAGATMPPDTVRKLRGWFPELKVAAGVAAGAETAHRPSSSRGSNGPAAAQAATTTMHAVPASVRQEFIRIGGDPGAKHAALAQVLRDLMGDGAGDAPSPAHSPPPPPPPAQVLVFCNTVQSARSTAFWVAEQGYSAACLHGDIPPARRAEEFTLFRSGRVPLLVATDTAARGLDFPRLGAVVMFDFPRTALDYLHRAGRVGRAGQARGGRSVSLCGPRDEALARGIEAAAATGAPLRLESLEAHARRDDDCTVSHARRDDDSSFPRRDDRRDAAGSVGDTPRWTTTTPRRGGGGSARYDHDYDLRAGRVGGSDPVPPADRYTQRGSDRQRSPSTQRDRSPRRATATARRAA